MKLCQISIKMSQLGRQCRLRKCTIKSNDNDAKEYIREFFFLAMSTVLILSSEISHTQWKSKHFVPGLFCMVSL